MYSSILSAHPAHWFVEYSGVEKWKKQHINSYHCCPVTDWLSPSLTLDLFPTLFWVFLPQIQHVQNWTHHLLLQSIPFQFLVLIKSSIILLNAHTKKIPHPLHTNGFHLSSWTPLKYILPLRPYSHLSLGPHHFLLRPPDLSSIFLLLPCAAGVIIEKCQPLNGFLMINRIKSKLLSMTIMI